MKAGTNKSSFIRIVAAAVLVVAPVAGCNSHPPQSSGPTAAGAAASAFVRAASPMPAQQGYPLHLFRHREAHVGVAVVLAFIGQKLLSTVLTF